MANISLGHDTSSGLGVCVFSVKLFNPYNMTNRPNSVPPLWIFLNVFNAIASPVTVITNSLIIWAVLGDEVIRSSVFNLLLAALALTDFFVGLVVEPLYILNFVRLLQENHSPCFTSAYFLSALVWCVITLVTFAITSVERYLAIEHPLFYEAHNNSKKKVFIVVTAVMWAVTPLIVICTSFVLAKQNPDMLKLPSMIVMIIFGLIIIYCTCKVFITSYRQSTAIASVQISTVQPQANKGKNKEYKRVFTFTMLVLSSVIFYCPFIIATAIEIRQGKSVTDFFRYSVAAIIGTFVHLQSLANPIIMSLRLSYIRKRIKKKLFSLLHLDLYQ